MGPKDDIHGEKFIFDKYSWRFRLIGDHSYTVQVCFSLRTLGSVQSSFVLERLSGRAIRGIVVDQWTGSGNEACMEFDSV